MDIGAHRFADFFFEDENLTKKYRDHRMERFSLINFSFYVVLITIGSVIKSDLMSRNQNSFILASLVIECCLSVGPAWLALALMVGRKTKVCFKTSVSSFPVPLDVKKSIPIQQGSTHSLILLCSVAEILAVGLWLVGKSLSSITCDGLGLQVLVCNPAPGKSGSFPWEATIVLIIVLMANYGILYVDWKFMLIGFVLVVVCMIVAMVNCDAWMYGGVALALIATVFCFTLEMECGRAGDFRMIQAAEAKIAQLQNALDVKKMLARYISHEVRSPLNIVHGGLEMVLAEAGHPSAGIKQSWIDQLMDILESSGVAINTLNDFLQFENMDAGMFELEMADMSVTSLVSKKLKPYFVLAKKKKVSFKIENEVRFDALIFGVKSAMIRVDEFRVDQVIRNMVTNAMKFTPVGGRVTIKLSIIESNTRTTFNADRDRDRDRDGDAENTTSDRKLESSTSWGGHAPSPAPAPAPAPAPMGALTHDRDDVAPLPPVSGAAASTDGITECVGSVGGADSPVTAAGMIITSSPQVVPSTLTLALAQRPLEGDLGVALAQRPLEGDLGVGVEEGSHGRDSLVGDIKTAQEREASFAVTAATGSVEAQRGPSGKQEIDFSSAVPVWSTLEGMSASPTQSNLLISSVVHQPTDGQGATSDSPPLPCTSSSPQAAPPCPPPLPSLGLRIEVIDTGAGIAPENHGKVFGQFQQFNRNELQGGGGSGLGLWISRQIAEMHGGSMGFSSEGLGKGCTFHLDLPLYLIDTPRSAAGEEEGQDSEGVGDDEAFALLSQLNGDNDNGNDNGNAVDSSSQSAWNHLQVALQALSGSADAGDGPSLPRCDSSKSINLSDPPKGIGVGAAAAAASARVGGSTERPMRVMIVDDSPMNRKFIRRILNTSTCLKNAHFVDADDGTTAVALMKTALAPPPPNADDPEAGIEHAGAGMGFDFVFLDSQMPFMHGPKAASLMRKELGFKGFIVGVTGYVAPDDIASFKAAGADDVLAKPLTSARADSLIKNLISKRSHSSDGFGSS